MPPTYFGASDIQGMLDTFGVPVVVGGVTAKGIVDAQDLDALIGEAMANGRETIVAVKTGTFTLSTGAPITVEGVAYKIASYRAIDDGALTIVRCVVS